VRASIRGDANAEQNRHASEWLAAKLTCGREIVEEIVRDSANRFATTKL
jgi:hypothetical protein